ncbi:MAG: hypothetical protein ACKN8Y_11880, partial [Polynucleobacter victoriensis]
MIDSADIRDLCGTMYHTYVGGGGDFEPGLATLQAVADYDSKAIELNKQKQEAEENGKEGPDLASLGPFFSPCLGEVYLVHRPVG